MERPDSCRIDVWLWRARLARTRSLAASLVENGAIRLTRHGVQTRLDKPSRSVHPGDEVLFVQSGRIIAVRVRDLGDRRGAPEAARALYEPMDDADP